MESESQAILALTEYGISQTNAARVVRANKIIQSHASWAEQLKPSEISFDKTVCVLQLLYLEKLTAAIFVGTPPIFNVVWDLIRVALDPSTVRKVHFADQSNKILKMYVDERELPVKLGGQLQTDNIPIPNIPNVPTIINL